MKEDITIHNLFPTPVGEFCYEGDMAPYIEIAKTYLNDNSIMKGEGNRFAEHDALTYPAFEDLTKWINKCLNDYYKTVFAPLEQQDGGPEIYITESWVNFTNNKEFHQWHNHANSFISGVFYLEAIEDAIEFNSTKPDSILIPDMEYFNEYNASRWWLPARTAILYLFPSWLQHSVPVIEGREEDRISIAFNTYLRGTVSSRGSTNLVL
jgi:uncharacterized protein (TIGR02466 family)